VIYPPDPLPRIKDVRGAIRHALANPHDSDPLETLLTRDEAHHRVRRHLAAAAADASARHPSAGARGVIELAASQGVEDVKLIVANSLHRRMTSAEIKHAVGERVHRSFYPKDLVNHDAEDRTTLVRRDTDKGEEVEINKRAMESDLLIYVNINLVAMAVPQVGAVGLASYKSIRHHHNVDTMLHSKSYMDPREGRSAIHDSCRRMVRCSRTPG